REAGARPARDHEPRQDLPLLAADGRRSMNAMTAAKPRIEAELPPPRAAEGKPLLELNGICKSFPGVKALDDVSFAVWPGEVHMLLGENGAGKSSLMKVLCGAYQAEEGEFHH